MEGNTFRSFFALPLSFQCRQEIDKTVLDLKIDLPSGIRWVKTENLHITLKFLGKFRTEDIEPIKNVLDSVLSATSQFTLSLQSLGVFPNSRYPKVVWIGIAPSDELFQIFRQLENAVFAFGYPKEERGFSPHLTIGRVKNDLHNPDPSRIFNIIKSKNIGAISESPVDKVVFFQSELAERSPVYTEVFSIGLKQ